MIPNQISNILIIYFVAVITMIVMLFFLPAIIELRKPKDAGPRIISDNYTKVALNILKIPARGCRRLKADFSMHYKNSTFLHAISIRSFSYFS